MAFSIEKNGGVIFTGVDTKMGQPLIAFKVKGNEGALGEIAQIQDVSSVSKNNV